MTRRQLVRLLAAFGAASETHGAGPAISLNHFKLRVSDLDKSVGFYYSLFGDPMAEITGGSYQTPPDMRAVFLKIGSGKTYLILSPPDPKVPVGLDHVAMDDEGMAVVRQNHIPLAFPNAPYVRDPDGNVIEFVTSGYWESSLPKLSPQLPQDVTNRQPVFAPVTIQRVALKVSDLRRSTDFYRLFGAEAGGATSKDRRSFDFKGTVLELISGGSVHGLDSFTVAVRNFDAASARRAFRSLGIKTANWKQHGRVSFLDPDGNRVEVATG